MFVTDIFADILIKASTKTSIALLICLFVGQVTSLTILPIPHQHAKQYKTNYDEFANHFLLPQDFDLAEKTPVKKPTSSEIDAMQNNNLFEGDIIGVPIDEDPTAYLNKILRDQPLNEEEINFDEIFNRPYHSSLNLVTYPDKLWTKGRVPYMLEEGMTPSQRAAIAQAFDEYKEKTCIRFVPRQDDDYDYIYIKRNVAFGCSSYVGRAGGNQTVSLEVGKCFTKGIIAHELMHALGFFHEHSRTDRDDFVKIDEENIRPGMLRNFEKYPRKIIDPLEMPYDYESVMHYHKLAFSKNGKPTIVPRDKDAEIGQRYKLSTVDAQKVNKLYRCENINPDEISKITTTTETIPTTRRPKVTTQTTRRTTSDRWASKPSSQPTTTTNEPETTVTTTPSTTTKFTTSKSTSTRKPFTKAPEKCENLNAHCDMWEQLGHCEHSAKYMQHYCRKSCGLCTEDSKETIAPPPQEKSCVDKNLFCGYWGKIGECKKSKFMKIFCKKSCGQCD
uniref:Metalloendopeptidase n=1 Tax=Panagrolaimus sp. PS1159 TaxID=55785 RepID=A0AC35GFD3_9BILA